jgi:hypothetical protein
MQLGWLDHFYNIVVPAWQEYLRAEEALSAAGVHGDGAVLEMSRYAALRQAGAAVFYLHHFADIVANERPECLPDHVRSLPEIRAWVEAQCVMLRSDQPVRDISLLGDVADALKHSRLTRRVEERDVADRDAVLVVGSGYGDLRYGEGKFGGSDQTVDCR